MLLFPSLCLNTHLESSTLCLPKTTFPPARKQKQPRVNLNLTREENNINPTSPCWFPSDPTALHWGLGCCENPGKVTPLHTGGNEQQDQNKRFYLKTKCYGVGYSLFCISVLSDTPHIIYLAALLILIHPWSFPPQVHSAPCWEHTLH